MTIPAKKLVTALLLAQAATKAEGIMCGDASIKEGWLDQCRTSRTSERDGGTVLLLTDWDWVLAFFIWYNGGGHLLRREEADRK